MKWCKDCRWCDPYIERDTTEYDTAYGWCEKKKKDVGILVWECALWRTVLRVAVADAMERSAK